MLLQIIRNVFVNITETVQAQFFAALFLGMMFFSVWVLVKTRFGSCILRKAQGERLSFISYGMIFFLFFYIAMILLKTLIFREIWDTPWGKVSLGWGLFTEKGKLTTESIENVILFIPYTFLLYYIVREQVRGFQHLSFYTAAIWCGLAAFYFSLIIELLQGVLSLGTFQWSDLTYNTLGGILGGILSFFLLRPDFES